MNKQCAVHMTTKSPRDIQITSLYTYDIYHKISQFSPKRHVESVYQAFRDGTSNYNYN